MDDELLDLVEAAEEAVGEEVAAVLQEVADEFARELADATEIVAARFSVSRIARMWAGRMPRIVRRLLRVSEQAAEHTAEAVGGELPPDWEDLPGRNDDGRQLPPVMREYVEVTEYLLNAVGDRLAEAAREELAAGVDAGEDIEQLRARLRERFAREGAQLGTVREERIARTEAGRAWNYAVLGAARDATGADRPLVKQWVTRRDTRVREDHAVANGQIQLLDEDFTVGGGQMAAPHDPDAPASQTVNCRCVLKVYPEVQASAFESQEPSPTPLENVRQQTAAAGGSHLMGGMIALMPTEQDAARLAFDGGEAAEELHLTLFFLGDDGSVWTEEQRTELADQVRAAARELEGPFTARAFGVNHWNPHTDSPSWVWAVGDDRDRPDGALTLEQVRQLVTTALEGTDGRPEMPVQHSPWVPHVCAQYGDDPAVLPGLVDRLGDITFDRIRLAFAGDHIDVPLGPQQEEEPMPEDDLQAAASLAVRTWSTPDDAAIAFEDEETGDGRIFKKGALKWDRRPMPLQYADEMLMGHQGAQLAGAIKKVKREGGRITASGVLYRTQSAGLDAEFLLDEDDPVLGISVDLDDVDIQLVDKTLTEEDADWLFASAKLPHASLVQMEDGSLMLSASTRAEWTASGGSFSRSRYDLQVITGPGGVLTAAAVREAFAGTGVLTAAAGDPDSTDGLVLHEQKSGELVMRITRARLRGATLVAMPAFKNARIVLDPPAEEETVAAVPVITAAGETRDRVVTYVCSSPAAVGARDVSRALGIAMSTARGHLNAAAKDDRIVRLAPGLFCGPSSMPEGHEETAVAPVTAAAGLDDEIVASFWQEMQDLPPMPADWFREPTAEELPPGSEGVHVAGGRIYGWVAQTGVPHAGYPGKNLTIEKLNRQGLDLTHFLRSRFALDDGTTAKCGVITMNVGHHRDGAECETDACLFDDTRTVAGIVTVGMSEGGMWFAGAANPKMSDWDRSVFKGCQPSYHLRQGPSGKWELRAVLSVPTPGHSSALLVAAVVERTNLALAASAAAVEETPGSHPDTGADNVRTASASSTDEPADLPGQRPDTASGQVPQVDVEALAAALAGGPLVDLLADAVTRRQDERRREIEEMAALVAEQPVTVTASAQNGAN
ncbi:phage minor head protein [Streptomyces sp. NPDC096538]|uniref:phage minor head protein n=1 Tax=Streptomyces sp. NPDC096538 TaxID=3155427 RepID=UPI00332CB2E8